MKTRKPRKARNLIAKAMHESGLFAPKTIPAKKGKGTKYTKRDRKVDLSGPSFWSVLYRIPICA